MKLLCYAVSDLEKPYIMAWAQKNNIETRIVKLS